MSVLDVLKRIGEKAGVDEDEISSLLEDEDAPEIDFDDLLPGGASDVLEVFLADGGETVEDKDGLIWAPLIRSGQFALRPGPKGQKVRRPLKIVAGQSKDPLKEIGLGDLTAAFYGDAVDYVTVPTSHGNSVLENTGFIRGMKVMKAPITTGPKKGTKVPTLFGGYDFTEPDVKEKVKRGTIPGRSCGILYNYENTETGDSWPSVVEHVALTSKPWIKGMMPFGRKLSERPDGEPIALSLSDEEPDEADETATILADGEDGSGAATISWTHEESPSWLRQQINDLLQTAREEKRKARRASPGMMVEEYPPYYRATEVKPDGSGGKALICDGYSDGSNHWVAGYTVDDGTVEIDDFKEWQAVKSVFVPDDRDPPDKKKEPLEEEKPEQQPTKLQMAQRRRKSTARGLDLAALTNPTHPRGGEKMDPNDSSNGSGTLQLSEEARQLIAAADARAEKAEKKAEELGEVVTKLATTDREKRVEKVLDELRGMDLDEKHGQTGFLNALSEVLSADDGEPAVVSESFSEGGDKEVELTLTEAFQRVFRALKKGEDGKLSLAEQLEQPSDDASTKAGEGKPDGADGKPPRDEKPAEPLSEEGAKDRAKETLDDNPEMAALVGGADVMSSDGGEK